MAMAVGDVTGEPSAQLPQPARTFVRSSRCEHAACVEVSLVPSEDVLVRDGKDRSGHVLAFAPASWSTFLSAVKAGEFDR